MQSRTSYFNKAIFLNTLKRFWPLWLAYFAIWAIIMPVTQASGYLGKSWGVQRDILDFAQQGGIIIGLGYGALAAMAVWSFMYNSKTMSGVACLPIKREGVFLSVTLAGILPAIVSNIVVCGLTILAHLVRGYASAIPFDLQWLAIVTMILLFFYGFATLCAQLTGNILTLPAVYMVLNFTAWVVESLVRYIGSIVMFGIDYGSYTISKYLSPVLGMIDGGARTEQVYVEATGDYVVKSVYYEGWVWLAVCALIGIVMLIGAVAIFRRRRMESVGDVVAVNVLKPVFKYCMTFGCALCSGFLFYNILVTNITGTALFETIGILIFMLFGAVVGYFAAEMLIHKSFRVFRGRWKGLCVSALVICAVMLGAEFDLLGIESRVPEADEVDNVVVIGSDSVSYVEPENIAAIVELHKSVIENKAQHEDGRGTGSSFMVYYNLKNGGSLERDYYLHYDIEDAESLADVEALENIQNSDEAITWRKKLPFEATEENIISGYVRATVSAGEMSQLDSGLTEEEIIIINYYGYDEEYVRSKMSEAEKQQLMDEYWQYNAVGYNAAQYAWDFTPEEMWELYSECILPDLAEGKIGKLWIVEDEEYMNTVYSARITIDMWYVPENATSDREMTSAATVPSPTVEYGPMAENMATYSFSITPTAESGRTTEWLVEHGVILHTVGEELDMYGYNDLQYGKYE